MPGAWENWVTSWHTKNIRNYSTYIDVGANCGYFTGLAAYYGLAVIAVEANPVYAKALRRTIEDNKFDRVGLVEAAVSNVNESTVELTVPDELHGGASIRGGETNLPGTKITVDTITLDTFSGPVGSGVLVKMDIEGAEEMAFEGASKFNTEHRPTYIMEYTPRHYSSRFYDATVDYGVISMVGYDGNETSVDRNTLDSTDDWVTIVVRPH